MHSFIISLLEQHLSHCSSSPQNNSLNKSSPLEPLRPRQKPCPILFSPTKATNYQPPAFSQRPPYPPPSKPAIVAEELRLEIASRSLMSPLSALCRRRGWSYAVLWRLHHRDPRLLLVEESYSQEQLNRVVESMLNRVHIVGQGSVGKTITSGKHKWIYNDAYDTDAAADPKSSLAIADCAQQFSAGIKTIVIVPLPSSGVVQFGSTKKVSENLEFIDQAKNLFQLIETVPGPLSHVEETKMHDQQEAFTCLISATDVCGYENNQSFHRKHRDRMINRFSTKGLSHSTVFPEGSSHISRSQYCFPMTSSSTGSSVYFPNQLQQSSSISKPSELYPSERDHAANDEARALISPSTEPLSNLNSLEKKVPINANTYSSNKICDLPMIDQALVPGVGTIGYSNLFLTNPSFLPSESLIHQFCGDSFSSDRQYRFQGSTPEARFSVVNDVFTCVSGKLPLLQHDQCDGKPVYDIALLFPEILGSSVASLQDYTPQCFCFHNGKHSTDQQPESISSDLAGQMNKRVLAVSSTSSNFDGNDVIGFVATTEISGKSTGESSGIINSQVPGSANENNSSTEHKVLFDCFLFDDMELDLSSNNFAQQYWDNIKMPLGSGNCSNLSFSIPETQMESTTCAKRAMSSGSGLEQLLDAIVAQRINESSSHCSPVENANPFYAPDTENQFSLMANVGGSSLLRSQFPSVCLPSTSQTPRVFPHFVSDAIHGSTKEAMPKSSVSSWIDDCCSMNNENSVLTQPKKTEDAIKVKKRARPGESIRPRPKDRQQIQDRVKELRDIVPNGSKCSIDALLDRTIKHMLFLQSVTKYADIVKHAYEPKIILEESGVVLKDNCCDSSSGGATWAYEVAGQTMVCPIMVEDLTPLGQMLVEMLCEERGIFLEIADAIRGFGLTILKGVMEIHEHKIWARFLVEANRDVTRLDIFLSLVQLLDHSNAKSSEKATKGLETGDPIFRHYHQSPITT